MRYILTHSDHDTSVPLETLSNPDRPRKAQLRLNWCDVIVRPLSIILPALDIHSSVNVH